MRSLLMGVSLVALMTPAAFAQTSAPKPVATQPVVAQPAAPQATTQAQAARYLVFFDLDKATLTADGRRVIADAAEEYKKTGTARIVATGYTDLSGSPEYNQKLSERRAQAVAEELGWLGVPADVITTVGKGESNPLVPTKDGVREVQNRRVEIVMEVPAKPVATPAPVVAAPPVAPVQIPPYEPRLGPYAGSWEATLAGSGVSAKRGGDDDDRDTAFGVTGSLGYVVAPWFIAGIRQSADGLFGEGVEDTFGGRSRLFLDFQLPLGWFQPFIGVAGGYQYGDFFKDEWIGGPEGGFKAYILENAFLYAQGDFTAVNGEAFEDGTIGLSTGFGINF